MFTALGPLSVRAVRARLERDKLGRSGSEATANLPGAPPARKEERLPIGQPGDREGAMCGRSCRRPAWAMAIATISIPPPYIAFNVPS